jgi:Ca-activated chloride channel family protein
MMWAGLALALLVAPAAARQVTLDVSMANPTLLAEKKQTTYLKVGLTGFEMSTKASRTPVNVSLVIDKSGSMSGKKIAKARDAAKFAVRRLSPRDIVSVVAYDSTVRVLVPATRLNDKEAVCRAIDRLEAGGTTALFAGVSKGAAELRKFLDRNRVNRVILLSDGLANVGPSSPSALGELGTSLIKEGISVSTMGMGADYNEDLLVELARRSDGNHIFIERPEDLAKIFNFEFDDVLSVVAQEVAIKVTLGEGIRPVRVLNRDAEINGRQVIIKLNQLYARQEKYILLEVEVPATKAGRSREVAKVEVSYANMETKTTDRLASTVRVNFDESEDVVEAKVNPKVMVECVIYVANDQNKLATTLRDRGDIAGAKKILAANAGYLDSKYEAFGDERLKGQAVINSGQLEGLEGSKWRDTRKGMRRYQHYYDTQQKY